MFLYSDVVQAMLAALARAGAIPTRTLLFHYDEEPCERTGTRNMSALEVDIWMFMLTRLSVECCAPSMLATSAGHFEPAPKISEPDAKRKGRPRKDKKLELKPTAAVTRVISDAMQEIFDLDLEDFKCSDDLAEFFVEHITKPAYALGKPVRHMKTFEEKHEAHTLTNQIVEAHLIRV